MPGHLRPRLALLATLSLALCCPEGARAAGGRVKFKTDNGPDGYFYNPNGSQRARFCSYYEAYEFEGQAVICGVRKRDLDHSTSPKTSLITEAL